MQEITWGGGGMQPGVRLKLVLGPDEQVVCAPERRRPQDKPTTKKRPKSGRRDVVPRLPTCASHGWPVTMFAQRNRDQIQTRTISG